MAALKACLCAANLGKKNCQNAKPNLTSGNLFKHLPLSEAPTCGSWPLHFWCVWFHLWLFYVVTPPIYCAMHLPLQRASTEWPYPSQPQRSAHEYPWTSMNIYPWMAEQHQTTATYCNVLYSYPFCQPAASNLKQWTAEILEKTPLERRADSHPRLMHWCPSTCGTSTLGLGTGAKDV